MEQQSTPEILQQEQSSPTEESLLPEKQKNSLQLKKWQLVSAGLILLAVGIGIGKFEPNNSPTPTQNQVKPLPVQTKTIELAKTYQTAQSYTGEVVAMLNSEVGFERGGKLVTMSVDEGDRITKGTVIGKLDTTNLAAQRQSLVAQKAQAEARLTELKNGARTEQISAAKARVRDIETQLELEKLKRDRREYLYAEGAISREQLDEVAFNFKALSERLADAKSNLQELLNGTRYEQVAAQQAAVDQLSAQIADLDITIAKSTLKAPFSGTVSTRYVDQGTVVETGKPIIRLVKDSRPEVKIGVPIDVAAKLSPQSGQVVEIGDTNYPAQVKSVLPEVDTATRTRTVILHLESTAAVSPKEIARLKVNQNIPTEGYWLPVTALVKSDRGLWSCYALITNNQSDSASVNNTKSYPIERRLVEVLETNGERALVKGTLQEGDTIVTDGTQRLVPGQLVVNQSI